MGNSFRAQPFDWMQYFYLSTHDPIIRAMLRLDGRIDPEILKWAVDCSARAVPQVLCCFSEASHHWEDRGFTAEQIVFVEEDREETGLAEEGLLETLDFTSGPQLKIFLVRGRDTDTLGLLVSHLLTDGAGFRRYLYLLAQAYSSCAAGRNFTPKRCDRSLRQVTKRFGLCVSLRILFSPMRLENQKESMLLPLDGKKGNPFCTMRTIGEEEFTSLYEYAKSEGATLNDLLMAAFFRALYDNTRAGKLTLPCPVDLRKYLTKESDAICNLVGNYQCTLTVGEGEDFAETLRKVSAQMTAQKNSDVCLKGPMLLDLLFHVFPFSIAEKLFLKNFHIPSVSYTNLGVLDAKRLCFGATPVTDAYLTTAIKHSPNFQVSVSSFAGKCTLSSNLNGTEHDRRVVEKFYDQMLYELETLIP